jgi:antirestriction protein ArdC
MRSLAAVLATCTPTSWPLACEEGRSMRRTPQTETRSDVYQRITDALVQQLEQGTRPWMKPWSAEHLAGRITRPLRHNGKPYRGINVLMLWLTAVERGYSAPIWMTFRQALDLGAHVRKGEKGTPVAYADTITRTDQETEEEREIWFMKQYTVFNVEQIDGLPAHFYATAAPSMAAAARLEHAEAFFRAIGARIGHGGNRAYYRISDDVIQMPPFEAFRDAESYYATLGHEAVHWTRHASRLDRSFDQKRFGDEGYAREELVAEIGSAFLAADLGLYLEPREDHAAYLASWLTILKQDKRAVFVAASFAQKAVDLLQSLQPKEEQQAA